MPKRQPNSVTVEMRTDYEPWRACSKEDSRPMLTGVYVDPKGYLVAADGFMLAVVPAKVRGPKTFTGAILPAPALEMAHRAIGRSSNTVSFTLDVESGRATVPVKASKGVLGTMGVDLITGTYPRWRALIPERKGMGARKYVAYDPTLIGRLARAIGSWPATINMAKGNGPAIILGHEGAFGVVMPMFAQEPDPKALSRVFRLRETPPLVPSRTDDLPPPAEIAEREAQKEG